MDAAARRAHWEAVHRAHAPEQKSWFQPRPETSLRLIRAALPAGGRVIDVGAGTSFLADELLADGRFSVALLDISQQALDRIRVRLGAQAPRAEFLCADIAADPVPGRFDLWHDRAVFHFLTGAEDRRAYARAMERCLEPGGTAIIAGFAVGGPTKCSGLDTQQHSAGSIAGEFPFLQIESEFAEAHTTPSGKDQLFQWTVLRRR